MGRPAPEPVLIALIISAAGIAIVLIAYFASAQVQLLPPALASHIPLINACINTLCFLVLAGGWLAIRRHRTTLHHRLMLTAFVLSALFLILYLLYHFSVPPTRFEGTRLLRTIYLTVLVTHIVGAAIQLPLALIALWFAISRNFARHRKIARLLLPLWLYVCASGVAVYIFLRGSYA